MIKHWHELEGKNVINKTRIDTNIRVRQKEMKREQGFTLLEVMLAVLLLVVALIPLIGMFSKGLLGSSDLESVIVASNLAQEKVEEIKNTAYGSISAGTENYGSISNYSPFKRTVAVSYPQAPDTDLTEVTVSVYWRLKATEQEVGLVTYIANY